MRPIGKRIIVDYKPENINQLDSGLYTYGEQVFDYLTLKVISAGVKCDRVKDGDEVLIRKESLFQADINMNELLFFTEEKFVIKVNSTMIKDNILAVPKIEEVSEGGIILLDNKQSKTITAKVVQVGEDCESVRVEDEIVFNRNHALEDGDFVYVKEDSVLCILGK